MITRGYFIGQIVDELSAISTQVQNLCRLNLTDLNLYLENFYKEVLNNMLNLELLNLNDVRSNNPGLDLGDEKNGFAFQITSTKKSKKINETLQKITPEDTSKYKKIHILIIGKKQGTYSALATESCPDFTEGDIWDISDLCKILVNMPIDRLQTLFNYVQAEVARVKIELEAPDSNGDYATNINEYFEASQVPKVGGCKEFNTFLMESGFGEGPEYLVKELKAFSKRLEKLPRVTRQFYAKLFEFRKNALANEDEKFGIQHDWLKRICTWSDINGELRLLESAGLAEVEPADPGLANVDVIWIYIKGGATSLYYDFHKQFLDFVEYKKFNLEEAFTAIDFSKF